jgi:hypothetical protein
VIRKMEMRHGAIVFDVPEGWIDRSTLLFVGPAQANGTSEAVSILFSAESSPKDALERQADEIRELDPKLEVLKSEPFEAPLGSGWCLLQRYVMNGSPVLQLAVALPVRGGLVIATAVAIEARFAKQEAELRRILSSLRSPEESG